jgi:hypothetical protein
MFGQARISKKKKAKSVLGLDKRRASKSQDLQRHGPRSRINLLRLAKQNKKNCKLVKKKNTCNNKKLTNDIKGDSGDSGGGEQKKKNVKGFPFPNDKV